MKPNIGQGDRGLTSLLGGGEKAPKDSTQVEAYGSLDELVSLIGCIRAENTHAKLDQLLEKVQDHLFRIESHTSTAPEFENHESLPYFGKEHVVFLEQSIEEYEKGVPALKNFILPGGTALPSKNPKEREARRVSALLHMARAETRRVERRLVALSRAKNLHPFCTPYLNRLSDVFFALARWVYAKGGLQEQAWRGIGKKEV